MRSNVTDLATERRRRARACDAVVARAYRGPSIEISPRELPVFAAPHVMHQLALMLDVSDDTVEISFEPRASLIERLRFSYASDEFVDVLRITLAASGSR